jgi:hypothetical protein
VLTHKPQKEKKNMGDKKNPNTIVIKSFIGPEEEGKHLLDCYYMPKPDDTYDFFDRDNKVKHRDIKLGESFEFELDLHRYILTLDTDPDKPGGYWGPWTTVPSTNPGQADGTYQAEAGGAGEEEEPNAASAGGY